MDDGELGRGVVQGVLRSPRSFGRHRCAHVVKTCWRGGALRGRGGQIHPRAFLAVLLLFYSGVVGVLGGLFVWCVRVRRLNPRALAAYIAARTLGIEGGRMLWGVWAREKHARLPDYAAGLPLFHSFLNGKIYLHRHVIEDVSYCCL